MVVAPRLGIGILAHTGQDNDMDVELMREILEQNTEIFPCGIDEGTVLRPARELYVSDIGFRKFYVNISHCAVGHGFSQLKNQIFIHPCYTMSPSNSD